MEPVSVKLSVFKVCFWGCKQEVYCCIFGDILANWPHLKFLYSCHGLSLDYFDTENNLKT